MDHSPIEIVVHVFSHLDYRDLLACSLVCRLFHSLVRENASCRYTIELAVAGMQDGPAGVLCPVDRLKALQDSQAAWHAFEWTASDDVRMARGSLYELYGGVLAQSDEPDGRELVFRQLASHYRGIEERVWSLDVGMTLRDFTMDPAQDLLVLVGQPRHGVHETRIETTIHLRSLTTGQAHAGARTPVLVHDVDARTIDLMFMLQVNGERVAVHFVSHGVAPSELVTWNWKTGETILNTYSANLLTFAFLTERLILVGGFGDATPEQRQPRLSVVDVDSCGGERMELERMECVCVFLYPACAPWVDLLSFLIRSDPCAGWTPHRSVQVPFSIGPGSRLYVVTVWAMRRGEVTSITLFVLSSTLLGHVATVGESGREFEWSEWGPDGTRMVAQATHSGAWVCYVFGTRFCSIARGDTLEMWDFNQLGIRRDKGLGQGDVEWHVGDTSVLDSGVFVERVRTRLPYRVLRTRLSWPFGFTDAMCSEDGVVLVDVSENEDGETRANEVGSLTAAR